MQACSQISNCEIITSNYKDNTVFEGFCLLTFERPIKCIEFLAVGYAVGNLICFFKPTFLMG